MEGYIIGALISIFIAFILFKSLKATFKILKNVVIGFIILFIYSFFTETPMDVNFTQWVIIGILGVPGAVLLILYRWLI